MWRHPPPSIEHLLQRHGLHGCRVHKVADLDCTVWRVARADGVAELCLRVYAPERTDTAPIDTEIAWLHALAEAGVHVPRPLADRHGKFRMTWQAETHSAPCQAVLLSWLPGRMLYRGLRPLHLRRIGELTARLHNNPPLHTHSRQAWTADPGGWARGERRVPAGYPRGLQASVQRAAAQLQQQMEGWPRDSSHWGFIHGDLHPWNIVLRGAAAGAIDFTDCGWGYWGQDLAGVLQFLKHPLTPRDAHHRAAYPALREALLDGYASLRPLPASLQAQIEPLIATRMLGTLRWIIEDWPTPDHRAWGPGFLAGLGAVLDQAVG